MQRRKCATRAANMDTPRIALRTCNRRRVRRTFVICSVSVSDLSHDIQKAREKIHNTCMSTRMKASCGNRMESFGDAQSDYVKKEAPSTRRKKAASSSCLEDVPRYMLPTESSASHTILFFPFGPLMWKCEQKNPSERSINITDLLAFHPARIATI